MAHLPAYALHLQKTQTKRDRLHIELTLPDIDGRERLKLQRDYNQAIALVEFYIRKGINAPNPRQTNAEKLRNARLIEEDLRRHLPDLENELDLLDRAIAAGNINLEREQRMKYNEITEARKDFAFATADVTYYEGRVAHEGRNVDNVQDQQDGNVDNVQDQQDGNVDNVQAQQDGDVDNVQAQQDGNVDNVQAQQDGNVDNVQAQLDGNVDNVQAQLDGNVDNVQAQQDGNVDNVQDQLNRNVDNVQDQQDGNVDNVQDQQDGNVGNVQAQLNRNADNLGDLQIVDQRVPDNE